MDNDCIAIASHLGYDSAVSNVSTANALTSRLFLPRMTLSPDPVLLHFELSGLKHLLKYHTLLPKA